MRLCTGFTVVAGESCCHVNKLETRIEKLDASKCNTMYLEPSGNCNAGSIRGRITCISITGTIKATIANNTPNQVRSECRTISPANVLPITSGSIVAHCPLGSRKSPANNTSTLAYPYHRPPSASVKNTVKHAITSLRGKLNGSESSNAPESATTVPDNQGKSTERITSLYPKIST